MRSGRRSPPADGAVAACRPAKPHRTSHFVGWARRDVQVQLKNRGYIRARISPPRGKEAMRTVNRPPSHVLLVHFIVVLAPLTALLATLCAVWPAARRRLVWLGRGVCAGPPFPAP